MASRSKGGYAISKNENPVTTPQEHPGDKQLITSHKNSRETDHVKDPTKPVQVNNLNTVSTTEPQAENKENGNKKKKKSTLKTTDGSPNTKKKKLTEEATEVDKKKDRRRRNKHDSRAQPQGNMDETRCKCFKASENLQ